MVHAKIFHHFEDLVETGVYCCEGTGTLEGGLHFLGVVYWIVRGLSDKKIELILNSIFFLF